MTTAEIVDWKTIQTWAEREREWRGLCLHPQLKLINRVGGIKDIDLRIPNHSFFPPNPIANAKISYHFCDITRINCDAIVNAAHSNLTGGGGVDGAIRNAAGEGLDVECRKFDHGCSPGQAVITGAYRLPSKFIIHTVGPVGEDPETLSSCYRSSLKLATETTQIRSLAFCTISTGHYKYASGPAAHVALRCVREFLDQHADLLERIDFVVYKIKDEIAYQELIPFYFTFSDSSALAPQSITGKR